MNGYCLLADLLVVVHLAIVSFIVVGMLLVLIGIARRWQWIRNFWFRAAHFLMIGIVAAESLGGIVCPLTDWEYRLRIAGGAEVEPGSFVGWLVHTLMFFRLPEWVFTVAYCVFALAVLATLIWVPPRRPRLSPSAPRK
jgi:hypothetical protein